VFSIQLAMLTVSVSFPVQESQAPAAHIQQALLIGRKTASSSSSSSKVGRSRLEEDGPTTGSDGPLHAVL